MKTFVTATLAAMIATSASAAVNINQSFNLTDGYIGGSQSGTYVAQFYKFLDSAVAVNQNDTVNLSVDFTSTVSLFNPDEISLWAITDENNLYTTYSTLTFDNLTGGLKSEINRDTSICCGTLVARYSTNLMQTPGNTSFIGMNFSFTMSSFDSLNTNIIAFAIMFNGVKKDYIHGGIPIDPEYELADPPAPPPGGVPEPATWAMMIMGFGMAGYGLRRRRLLLS